MSKEAKDLEQDCSVRPFTVLGLHDPSGKVFADQVFAEGPHSAMALVAKRHKNSSDVQIIGAIYGHEAHGITAPCEDSGKAAYACDLTED